MTNTSHLSNDIVLFWSINIVLGTVGEFLDASSHLYKRACPSIGPSVGPSVRRSVGPSVGMSRFCKKMHETESFLYRNDQQGI